jgi:hypothetical protein
MIQKYIAVILLSIALTGLAEDKKKNWSEDFGKKDKEQKLPPGWEIKATKWGVNETSFKLQHKASNEKNPEIKGVLEIAADKATGALFFELSKLVDLKKTPVMRWRWRVNVFPKGGDGRKSQSDDQAIAIYIGASDWMVKKSIAYRWETQTPLGCVGEVSYAGGAVKVKWFCLRNRQSGEKKWVVEERNIAEDYKNAYGFIPEEFALSIGANSQHTKSESLAYIDYIEFLPAEESKTLKVASRSEKTEQ